jgi:glycine dehydrogenase subunit 1
MQEREPFVHPYIPNSVPRTKEEMLVAVGATNPDEFYADVPADLRVVNDMTLPEPTLPEYNLRRHVKSLLAKNRSAQELLIFRGAGCYDHYVPAVCDEVNRRSEFLTAYAGEPYDDHGRFQALFEYASMMGELLNMDVVNVPTYDGFQATATALRMAARITGRNELVVCGPINPAKLSKIRDYCRPGLEIVTLPSDAITGMPDLGQLQRAVSRATAAVYFENPSYFGIVEGRGASMTAIAHQQGALCIVSADPISLGILTPPADCGADIVCGDIQSLGMHMQYGGGHAGYIATRDEERFVMEYPSRLFGIAPTDVRGEYGFGDVAYERTSFAVREEGKEWVGTAAALWGITAGVYLALMGPAGMAEIGETILARTRYAMIKLGQVPGIEIRYAAEPHFREFVVNVDATGRTVTEINRRMLEHGIVGGHDLTGSIAELGRSMLLCVTEVHSQEDIDLLARTLMEVL